MSLHTTITASQVNPQPSPTPNLATNAVTPNTNWDTFSKTPVVPTVPSSTLDNPGVVHAPPASSPNVAPSTHDPALIITTADARATYQWPDGSWRQYPYTPATENLAYGTGPLYANAGGFGSNKNSGSTGPGQTYNTNSFTPPVGFALVPNNSPYK
jgi:hypothetical protein